MGLFRTFFNTIKKTSKYGFYVGSFYTFFGYLYVQEIKHRLGDTDFCHKKQLQQFVNNFSLQQQLDTFSISFAFKFIDIYTFYARTWNFRQFDHTCKRFHKNVIQSLLKNYEEYGIFNQEEHMDQQIKKGEINPSILSKILQVKQLNSQLTNLYQQDYFNIVELQKTLKTGCILGLTDIERRRINLIYSYIQKGEKFIFKNEEKYWQYKLMQSQARKHQFDDIIFKIIFI